MKIKKFIKYLPILVTLIVGACTAEDVKMATDKPDVQEFPSEENNVIGDVIDMIPTRVELTNSESTALKASENFNINYFKKSLNMMPGENAVISPLSATLLMSLLANACDDKVSNEISLMLGTNDIESLNSLAKRLLENLPSVDKSSTLSLANSVWYDRSLSLTPGKSDLYQNFYDAEINAVGLLQKEPEALSSINRWVNDHTGSLIPKILDYIPDNLVAVLINTLYFKGSWQDSFEPEDTKESLFHGSKGDRPVEMMHSNRTLPAYVTSDFTAVSKKLGTGNFEVVFMLPAETQDISGLLDNCDFRILYDKGNWESYKTDLSLPKTKCKNADRIQLNNVLGELGCPSILSSEGILSNLFSTPLNTVISIYQDGVISFDELGVEGAAVTFSTMDMAVGPGLPEIKTLKIDLNRPYLFFIMESATNTILFAGKVESV